jgi:hypothetical protein
MSARTLLAFWTPGFGELIIIGLIIVVPVIVAAAVIVAVLRSRR